jgi:IPT/TIG domain
MRKTCLPRFLLMAAAVFLGACHGTERGPAAANAVAYAAGALSVTHGVLDAEVKNPVTGLTVILYDCIAREANAFAGAPEPPYEVPPLVREVVAGPATGRDRGSFELTTDGPPLSSVSEGQIVSLVGAQLSAVKEHNLVKIDGQAAPFSALSSNTLLTTAIPFLRRDLPAEVDVQVLVRGVPSQPVTLTVVKAPRVPLAPSILAKRVLHKQYRFARQIQAMPWAKLAEAGDPTTRAQRLAAADKLNQCSRDLFIQLKAFDTKLNEDARFLEVHDIVLYVSPTVETLIDRALEALPPADETEFPSS